MCHKTTPGLISYSYGPIKHKRHSNVMLFCRQHWVIYFRAIHNFLLFTLCWFSLESKYGVVTIILFQQPHASRVPRPVLRVLFHCLCFWRGFIFVSYELLMEFNYTAAFKLFYSFCYQVRVGYKRRVIFYEVQNLLLRTKSKIAISLSTIIIFCTYVLDTYHFR